MAKRFKVKKKYTVRITDDNISSNLHRSNTGIKENKKRRKKRKHKTNLIKSIIFIIFLLTFIFSIVNLARWVIYNKKSENLIEKIIEDNFIEEKKSTESIIKNPVNFEELKNINEDVVAWIKIAETTVNYPIVQAEDNEYYLQKDLNKKNSTCGWIFMNFKNNSDFSDRNTTIFGHNLKSGLMFKDLLKIYRNELGEDVKIEIYTQEEKMEFAVYSSYMIQPEEYATKVITTDKEQEEYITEILNRSSVTYNIVPSKRDKLITLSTCDNSGKNRVLIHGVYVSGERY